MSTIIIGMKNGLTRPDPSDQAAVLFLEGFHAADARTDDDTDALPVDGPRSSPEARSASWVATTA
jgi:hypothetical protein